MRMNSRPGYGEAGPACAPGVPPARCHLRALAFAAALFVAVPACAAEDEPEAVPVPWDQIEAWAAGTDAATAGVLPAAQVDPKAAEPPPAWVPARKGERRPEPPAYLKMLQRITQVMAERLNATPPNEWHKLYDIYALMEQHDRAIALLTQIQNNPKLWTNEYREGWTSGRLWETFLVSPVRARPEVLERCFNDWKEKKQKHLADKEGDPEWVANYKKGETDWFRNRQDYYASSPNIADVVRELDLKGDGYPEPLWDLCQRYQHQRPEARLSCLRTLYRLRDWYPDYEQCAKGEVQMRICRLLRDAFNLHREAAAEAERLMAEWPQCEYTQRGDALYTAAEDWLELGNTLAPKKVRQPRETKDALLAREARELQEARDAWSKAKPYYLRLQKEYPKHWSNQKDKNAEGVVQPSHNERRLSYLNASARLAGK